MLRICSPCLVFANTHTPPPLRWCCVRLSRHSASALTLRFLSATFAPRAPVASCPRLIGRNHRYGSSNDARGSSGTGHGSSVATPPTTPSTCGLRAPRPPRAIQPLEQAGRVWVRNNGPRWTPHRTRWDRRTSAGTLVERCERGPPAGVSLRHRVSRSHRSVFVFCFAVLMV